MVGIVNGKVDNSRGILNFEILRDIELETIVPTDKIASEVIMFNKGAAVEGLPIMGSVTEIRNGKIYETREVSGVVIERDGGTIIIPFDFVEEKDFQVTPRPTGGVLNGESINDTIDKVAAETDKIFGFTPKQLLVIAVATILIAKIVK
jgi:hypothetical protein